MYDENGARRFTLPGFFQIPGMLTLSSMAVFAVFYWLAFDMPIWVAVGFTVGLFIHEMGHMVMFWHYKMATTPPVFMPFVGAVISMKEEAPNAWAEAWIGMGGPLAGAVAAVFALIGYHVTGSADCLQICILCCGLNLMNLLPLSPLDGGHVTGAIWRWFWLVGILLIGSLAALTGSTMLCLVVLVGMTEIDKKVAPLSRWLWIALFVGMAAAAIYWANPFIALPASFALSVARKRFSQLAIMIHVPDKDASGEDEFQLLRAAIKRHPILSGASEDAVRELWKEHFTGNHWSSMSTELTLNLEHGGQTISSSKVRVMFVNTGYFDIPSWQRLVISGVYAGLIGLLVMLMWHALGALHPAVLAAAVKL